MLFQAQRVIQRLIHLNGFVDAAHRFGVIALI
jgi:hypothetical protein